MLLASGIQWNIPKLSIIFQLRPPFIEDFTASHVWWHRRFMGPWGLGLTCLVEHLILHARLPESIFGWKQLQATDADGSKFVLQEIGRPVGHNVVWTSCTGQKHNEVQLVWIWSYCNWIYDKFLMCFFQISSWTTSMLWISEFNGYSLTFDPEAADPKKRQDARGSSLPRRQSFPPSLPSWPLSLHWNMSHHFAEAQRARILVCPLKMVIFHYKWWFSH